jgi:hypothetical protein
VRAFCGFYFSTSQHTHALASRPFRLILSESNHAASQ